MLDRIALADDIHLTRRDHLVTVATTRWEPGIFAYDVEYLTVDARPHGDSWQVTLAARGANYPHQVLRFDLDAEAFARFDGFVARARAVRDELRASSAG